MSGQQPDAAEDLSAFRDQARRYMEARYSEAVWFRAPETFTNVLEQWIWAVASGAPGFGETCMAQIEEALAGPDQAGPL